MAEVNGNRTHPGPYRPNDGFEDRGEPCNDKGLQSDMPVTCQNCKEHPELAELIERWADLPDVTKGLILAAVKMTS